MPSFDVVSVIDKVELSNSIDQANKEITNRFDFKGSDARIENKDFEITLLAEDDFKLGQVKDILVGKMSKRGIDLRVLSDSKKISGNKEVIQLKNGISQDLSKEITRTIKDSKIKVTTSIQGDAVRVTGAKRNDLQEVIQLLKQKITEQPLQFENFRD